MLALDQLVKNRDTDGKGICVGQIKQLRVLGYADDVTILGEEVEELTTRLTNFADAAIEEADMYVKLKKTFSQIVQDQEKAAPPTEQDIKEVEQDYKFTCEFADRGCTVRLKTQRAVNIHSVKYTFGYGATEESFEIEEIKEVYGKASRRLFKVKWVGYDEMSWEPEHHLIKEGCKQGGN